MNNNTGSLTKKNIELSTVVNELEANPEINEAEVKVEAIYNALKCSIPEELHSVLASLDGAYGERQMRWQEQMFISGFQNGRESA